jgi:Matrixin
MEKINKTFAVALFAALMFAAMPLALLCPQSDTVQVWHEIRIGEENARPDAPGKTKPSPDYKISINRGETVIPVTLTVYTDNKEGLGAEFIIDAVSLAAQEWDDHTNADLLSATPVVEGTGVASVTFNGENAVYFATYSDENVIAVASYWYSRVTREIFECDIMFNAAFAWGDAEADPEIMDLQNIATHELGHFFNLADIYDTSKDYLTMYGYSWEGDLQKRDLAIGDIAGIQKVFGA